MYLCVSIYPNAVEVIGFDFCIMHVPKNQSVCKRVKFTIIYYII